ncbi:MAG: hypothetical protein ACYTF6_13295 [Planctomycetota bacterium]|jgi:hypothetical protein
MLRKKISGIAAGLVVIGLLAGAASAERVDPFSLIIETVRNAKTPSKAIAAYASGLAVDRRSVKLHEAYVSRMLDFGLVETTYYQAQLLVSLDEDRPAASPWSKRSTPSSTPWRSCPKTVSS